MSVTITGNPADAYKIIPANSDLVFTATSTQVASANFQFIVVVKDSGSNEIFKAYIPPNSSNVLMFDCSHVAMTQVDEDRIDYLSSNDPLWGVPHSSTDQFSLNTNLCKEITIELGEYYGTTPQEYAATATHTFYVFDAKVPRWTAASSPENVVAFLDDEWLTDMRPVDQGSFPANAVSEGIDISGLTATDPIFIKASEDDWGVLAFVNDDGTTLNGCDTTQFAYSIWDSTGSLLNNGTITISAVNGGATPGGTAASEKILYAGFYPANLSDTNSVLVSGDRPVNNPTWKYYVIQAQDGLGAESLRPVVFIKDDECLKHERIILYWQNRYGGWDQLPFNLRASYNHSKKSKMYSKIRGDRSASSWSPDIWQPHKVNYHVENDHMITIRGNFDINQYSLLRHALQSKHHVIYSENDVVDNYVLTDLQYYPVLLESSSYEEWREPISQNHVVELNLKLAYRDIT